MKATSIQTRQNSHFFASLNPLRLFSDLYRNRELLWQFTLRNIHVRHKGSLLGIVWAVVTPLLLMALYTFVFGIIFEGEYGVSPTETSMDFALGIFLGLMLFHLVSETMGAAPALIVGNTNLVKKVIFPLEILPVATVGASLFHFFISLGLLFAGILVWGNGLSAGALWLPVIVFPLILLSLGIAWLVSALGVFFRDLSQAMPFLTMTLLYSSAIFYSAEKASERLPDLLWQALNLNPLIHAIELAREVVLWRVPLDLSPLIYIYAVGVASCLIGYACFSAMKSSFADVL